MVFRMSIPPSQHSAAPASTAAATALQVCWTDCGGLGPVAVARLIRELPAAEGEQAERFHFDADRAAYVAGHAVLRRVLRARLDGAEPAIAAGAFGRPELAPPQQGDPPLSFNLTHIRGFAACAIYQGAPVGIDAEDIRRPAAIAEIAARWYAPGERRLLARLPEARRAEMFFRIWTLKEAILKASGLGLRLDLRQFSVDPESGRAEVPDSLGIPTSWRLAELAPLPHIRVALAVPGSGPLAPAVTRVELA